MNKLVLAAVAASFALTAPASATDLYGNSKAAASAADPFKSGPYVSVYGGGVISGMGIDGTGCCVGAKGWEGGLRGGYDHRFTGTPFVAGVYVEGGIGKVSSKVDTGDISGSINQTYEYGAGVKFAVTSGRTEFYSLAGWTETNAKTSEVSVKNLNGARLALGVEQMFSNGFSVAFEPSWTIYGDNYVDGVKVDQESIGVRLIATKRF